MNDIIPDGDHAQFSDEEPLRITIINRRPKHGHINYCYERYALITKFTGGAMQLLNTQNNQSAEFSDAVFRLENKKNAVRIRKRVRCEVCGKFFLQRSKDVRRCHYCGDDVSLGQKNT